MLTFDQCPAVEETLSDIGKEDIEYFCLFFFISRGISGSLHLHLHLHLRAPTRRPHEFPDLQVQGSLIPVRFQYLFIVGSLEFLYWRESRSRELRVYSGVIVIEAFTINSAILSVKRLEMPLAAYKHSIFRPHQGQLPQKSHFSTVKNEKHSPKSSIESLDFCSR